MTKKTQIFTIRKDAFHGVSKQWCCDAETSDGSFFKYWCYGFRTRRALVAHINDFCKRGRCGFSPNASIVNGY